MNNLYEKISELRRKNGFTQAQLAEKIGIKQSNYAKIEKGDIQITIERLFEIAKVFEVSVVELLGVESVASVDNSKELEELKKEIDFLKREKEILENEKDKLEANKFVYQAIVETTYDEVDIDNKISEMFANGTMRKKILEFQNGDNKTSSLLSKIINFIQTKP